MAIVFKKAKALISSTNKLKGRGRDRREASLLEKPMCTMTPEQERPEHGGYLGRWATGCLPEPQGGTTNVSVPGKGEVPESKLRSLGGGIKRTQRDLLGSGSQRVEGA